MGGAKVAADILFRFAALLSANDHHFAVLETSEAAHDRAVVSEQAVAVEFGKVSERGLQVIEGKWAARVTGELDALPCGEVGENLFACLGDLAFDVRDFLFEIEADGMGFAMFLEFFQLGLQLGNRFFKIKLMFLLAQDFRCGLKGWQRWK